MTAADVALYDEAQALIAPEHRSYGHVILDEAQNLSPMELRMLARRARGRSMTILGDITQRNTTGVTDWGAFLAGSAGERVEVRRLGVSYRVPEDSLRLAARIAGDGSEIPTGVRAASMRPFAVAAVDGELGSTVAAVTERLVAEGHSVGVVARPAGGPGGLYTALTRATRAVAIVHAEPLPAALADAPELRRMTAV